MSRWQLARIVLYSLDNRFAELKFRPSAVNIIVGDSNTGKSAIAEIINYCMGSSECLIPDHIQKHCSWVAIQMVMKGKYCFVARKLPPLGNQQGANAYHVRTGMNAVFPRNASGLQEGSRASLHRLEELLGIGKFSLFEEPEIHKGAFSISVRHTIPYLLLSDDVITSKGKLFWDGQGRGAGHRFQRTIDTLPYFLGILDEDKLRKKSELQNLMREWRRLKREIKEAERIAYEGSQRVEQFLQKAREMGMIGHESVLGEEIKKLETLKLIANWQSGTPDFHPTGELPDLRLQEEDLRSKLNSLEKKKKAVQRTINEAEKFHESILLQSSRLETINLLDQDTSLEACPLCNAPLNTRSEPIERLREALMILSQDVGEIKNDRPRLDEYMTQLIEEADQVRQQYRIVKKRIEAIVSQNEELEKQKSLDDMRQHLSGMVDLFLQSRDKKVGPGQAVTLRELEDKITVLEAELDEETLSDAMQAMSQRIAHEAMGVLDRLPFEEKYRGSMVIFDYKKLQCHLLEGTRTIPMPVIGSDENYLSLHLSIFLALHRVFGENNRPVPGMIVLDQVSRPYFPREKYQTMVNLKDKGLQRIDTLMDERTKVSQIFDVLFKEVEKARDLQIIVCEKAYFSEDARFIAGVRAVWAKPEGLVPQDWPSRKQ